MAEDNQQLETEKKKGYMFKKGGRVSPSLRRKDVKVTAAARKLISLASPKGSLVKSITRDSSSKGRGRPSGTFKTRVLPSGRVVKVPTHIYKKLLAQEKAQMRLAVVQRQFEAEQLAMQQDPRFQPSTDEAFLSEPDQIHEMNVLRAQQEAERAQLQPQRPGELQKRPGLISRAINGIGRLGGSERAQTQQVVGYDEYGRPIVQQMVQRPPVQDMRPREPRVNVLNEKSSILNTPNIFNNPGQSNLARRRSV